MAIAGELAIAAQPSAGRDQTNRVSPRGFTLLELLLTLAIVSALLALVWPALAGPLARARLERSADRVRAQLQRTRNQAMLTGTVHSFRYVPTLGQFRREPFDPSTIGVSDAAPAGFATSAAGSVSGPGSVGAPGSDLPAGVYEASLADGVGFVPIQPIAGQTAQFAANEAGSQTGWSDPILFFPDGTATSARIELEGISGRRIAIEVRGLTGSARVSEVYAPGGVP